MEFIEIKKDNELLIKELSSLASFIIREYYDPILGERQNTYMINKFQSIEAINDQLDNNYHYYLLKDNGKNIGFVGYYFKDESLYLSKLYFLKEERNKHYGTKTINFLIDIARSYSKKFIELNVNRYNYDSIKAYEAMGFIKIRQEDNDIGNSYYMNDYVYMKKIGDNDE